MSFCNKPEKLILNLLKRKKALPAFNVTDVDMCLGILDAAENLNSPAIIQTSQSTVRYYKPNKFISQLMPYIESSTAEVILHLDHCDDINLIKECLDAGWNSVMFDGSHFDVEMNSKISKQVKDLACRYNAITEFEIGSILGEEDQYGGVDGLNFSLDDLIKFLTKVEPTMMAVGIGNKHGEYFSGDIERVKIDLLDEVNKIKKLPLVFHGGSGFPMDLLLKTIKMGVVKINISTALKMGYKTQVNDWLVKESTNILELKRNIRDTIKTISEHYFSKFQNTSDEFFAN